MALHVYCSEEFGGGLSKTHVFFMYSLFLSAPDIEFITICLGFLVNWALCIRCCGRQSGIMGVQLLLFPQQAWAIRPYVCTLNEDGPHTDIQAAHLQASMV